MAAHEMCTVKEAASILGVSPSTVWRWVDSRRLDAIRVGPRAIRIRRRDVEAAIQPLRTQRIYTDVSEIPRRTAREHEEALAAIDEAERWREKMRRRRGGKPLSSSLSIIRRARDERSARR